MTIRLPNEVESVITALDRAGYEAYVVGGPVRDALLGRDPSDWDITTSAKPNEVTALFGKAFTVPTGLRHGTVTVRSGGMPIEVTTYRTEGEYQDHRHPDRVTFSTSLEEDLARRDFTVNAIAYHPAKGFVDPFGGIDDLSKRILRAVRDPSERFEEDALRILRLLRFSSTLFFKIDPETRSAAYQKRQLLHHLSAERIREELTKLLCGPNSLWILLNEAEILFEVLPELRPMYRFDQRTPWHCFDIWEHSVRALDAIAPDPILRWTMLLHDCGKPASFTVDDKGIGHFKGHAKVSAELSRGILSRLKFDNSSKDRIIALIESHMVLIHPSEKGVRRQMGKLGTDTFQLLLQVIRADHAGQYLFRPQEDPMVDELARIYETVLEQDQCFSLKQLAVTGKDLLDLGVPEGKRIGEMLQQMLDAVIDGTCPNEKDDLLSLFYLS